MSKPIRLLVRYGTFDGERPAQRRRSLFSAALPWPLLLALGGALYALIRYR